MSVRLLFAILCGVLALTAPARAQTKRPRPVEDIEIPTLKKPAPPPEELPVEDASDDSGDEDTFIPGKTERPRARDAGFESPDFGSSKRDAGASSDAALLGTADAGNAVDAGAAAPAGLSDKSIKPLILPPADGDAQLLAAWAARREALGRSAVHEMLEHERKIARLREELGYSNLLTIGAALSHESKALVRSDAAEAVRRAVLATQLAPDLPAAHWAVARSAWSEDLADFGRYLDATLQAVKATWREPRWRAATLAEIAAALLGAFLLAGAAVVLLVFLRHVRYFLHDVHHLFPSGSWRAQTSLAGILFVLLPLLFGLGPFLFLFGLALASWLHMGRAEKAVVAALMAVFGLLPLGASLVEREAAFSGTRAELIYLVEHGGPDGAPTQELQALADRADAPFEALFAQGHRARRRGDVPAAVSLLRQAAELKPGSPQALIELGNALFLAGDLDGARDSYQRLLNANEASPMAHHGLARLYDRRAQLARREEAPGQLAESQKHQRRLVELDPQAGMAIAGDTDLRSNRYLPATTLGGAQLMKMAAEEAHPSWVGDDLSKRLFGPLPCSLTWLAGLLAAGLLLLFSLLQEVIVPCGSCGKCGRPVCRRCDVEVVGPGLCGQCVTILAQRGAVDPPARASKELHIKRYQRLRVWAIRLCSLLIPGGGQGVSGQAPLSL
ncbi:MAG: tetratricopeptide repeat protein, partial [Deltaproteobacteria bacterium]|nr:tetratricopeptide repeat protein [Deltaproteobacteria bacterium]